jgi:serine/threonine protein kinase
MHPKGTPEPDSGYAPDNPLYLVRGELAIYKKLNHPNVIRLIEVLDDQNSDSLFMVFEMCSKGAMMDITLDKDAKPLDPELTWDYFRQIVLGMEYLHESGVIHRDIKPDNMLVTEEGVLKLVDFGVSSMFSKGNDNVASSAGSPAFMAPVRFLRCVNG